MKNKYKSFITSRFTLHILFIASLQTFSVKGHKFSRQSFGLKYSAIESDTIIRIDANPDSGFNYPYYLRIPKGAIRGVKQFLLVETNNTGVNDSLSFHDRGAYLEAKSNSLGSSLCSNLKIPFLVPVFPRPAVNWKIYTHALDRDAALVHEGDMKRLDLQLMAMIKNARIQLAQFGVAVHEKILMNGFSASGSFANRFALIHSGIVAAVACGGINAIPILPIKKIGSHTINYPIGINDAEKIFGDSIDWINYKKVPQFIYMGEYDNNDAVLFNDAYSKKERRIIVKKLGKSMLPTRWNNCKAVYEQEKISATFKIYSGIGHETNKEVFRDVIAFFTTVINEYKE